MEKVTLPEGHFRSDEDLLLDYRNGDNAAFEDLANRYSNQLFTMLRHRFRDPNVVEAVLNDTFARVACHAERFEQGRSFKAWLFGIANHVATDLQRSEGRRPHHGLDDTSIPSSSRNGLQTLIQNEEHEQIRDALQDLPEGERICVVLRYFCDKSCKEIADVLEIPSGTVRYRLLKARGRIQERLGFDFRTAG